MLAALLSCALSGALALYCHVRARHTRAMADLWRGTAIDLTRRLTVAEDERDRLAGELQRVAPDAYVDSLSIVDTRSN